MIASFNIDYEKRKNKCLRREIFNLKNHDCQLKFFEETNKGVKFQKCFNLSRNFEDNCNKFLTTLDDSMHKCFKKIRIRKNPKGGETQSEAQDLIMEKNKLALSLQSIKCKLGRCIVESEISR